jgi:hypothetical protein
MKLNPTLKREPELYFLKNDVEVDLLVKEMLKYHWKMDGAGNWTKDPDKEEDDRSDAIRYVVMNNFAKTGKVTVAPEPLAPPVEQQRTYTEQNWMKQKIQELTGGRIDTNQQDADKPLTYQKGKFFFSS